MTSLSVEEIKQVAEEAAKAAVRDILVAMGVDAHDPHSLIDMQKDFAHIRTWRESTETIKNHGMIAAVSFVVTGAFGYLVFLFHK